MKHGIWFHYLSTVMSAAMAFVMLTQLINQHWFIRMVSMHIYGPVEILPELTFYA